MNKETVSPSPWMRKTFVLEAEPERALAYVNALGYYELYVNGRKVGADVLSPAVSDYRARSFYVTYDITPLLRKGRNCVGLWLGRGWHVAGRPGVSDGGPMVRFQGEIVAGGKKVEIVSDETWKCAPSPYATLGPWHWISLAASVTTRASTTRHGVPRIMTIGTGPASRCSRRPAPDRNRNCVL